MSDALPGPVLVIVPCGHGKVWDRNPAAGPTRARDAYTGAPFKVNRAYAETFADSWIILSAKYGFIPPDFRIPEPYEVTFKKKATQPVSLDVLLRQRQEQHLDRFGSVIVLGGKEYRLMVTEAFGGTGVKVLAPFAGLPLGKAMSATKRAMSEGRPVP